MVKWIVGGKPRMALFAGDNPIMSGDELTYDYNFDPFSAKNVQECRCGSDNCRGVLGPRPKDQKPVKESIKEAMKAGVKAGKRKLKELLGGEGEDTEDARSPKKRKIKEAKGVKRSASSASMKIAKGAAKAIKEGVSAQLSNARQSVSSRRGSVFAVKTKKASTLKTYGKRQAKLSSRNSSLTIVEGATSVRTAKGKRSIAASKTVRKTVSKSVHGIKRGGSFREENGETIRVITGAEEDVDEEMGEA
jgi:histone-lysine N-methyltransferase ASH1L